jgi:hypothetical protein
MANYGYRVFQIELRALNTRSSASFENCQGEHYSVHAARILDRLLGQILVEDTPSRSDEEVGDDLGDPLAGRRAVRVIESIQEGNTIWLKLHAGRYGDHAVGLGAPGEEDVPLIGRAPAFEFRAIMHLPSTGKVGLLVVEDINRSCPMEPLRKLLRNGSQALCEEARERAKTSDPGKPQLAPMWWKLDVEPAVDVEAVDKLMTNGQTERIELRQYGLGGKGRGQRRQVRWTFTAPDLSYQEQAETRKLAATWGRDLLRFRRADPVERKKIKVPSELDGARAIAAILGPQIEALNFDDGYVVVSDEEGRLKNISPTRLNEVFTYPLHRERQPSDVVFDDRSRGTARKLARLLKITGMDWVARPE